MTNPEQEKRLFVAALELPTPAERDAFLRGACADNPELYQRLQVLVAMHDQSQGPLDRLPSAIGAGGEPGLDPGATCIEPQLEEIGTEIGRYKLLQRIGEGGMGTVFMADQHDPVKRRVALKVIKPGMDSRQVIARFEAERQALSMMDHPNIAKVLDAGTTPNGRPYFVMELVKGQPITQYCDEQHLTPRERLEVFLPVCHAIQHAHQKGIIHRDIKPSNVLVAEYDGRPVGKVIDFGVAKAMSQSLTERTIFTEMGAIVGTLEYMSPEQARVNQLDIDTRSDVYSLGVLLYELLTGSTPFERKQLRSAAFEEMLRIIREVEPPRPSFRLSSSDTLPSVAASRRTEPTRLSALVRGELDWIVMKALEKDRNRRYETANGFALDIQRYLADEPVQACPPSAAYRLRKFARRNKTRLITSSLASLAVITMLVMYASFTTAARQREQLTRQQTREREQAAAREVELSLVSARTAVDVGNLTVAERKLGEASSRIDVAGSQAGDLGSRIAQLDQEIRDRARDAQQFSRFIELARDGQDKMSHSSWKGGETVAAEALQLYSVLESGDWLASLERAYLSDEQKQTVRDTAYETLIVLADFGPRWQKTAAAAERSLEHLRRAEAIHEPTRAFFWVRAECRKLLKDDQAASADTRRFEETAAKTAFDYYLPGHSAGWAGDRDEAIRSYEAALLIQPDHYNSLFFLAWRLSDAGRYSEAKGVAMALLALRPKSAETLNSRAISLEREGKYEQAVSLYRRAIDIDPEGSVAYFNLASSLKKLGKLDDARYCFERVVEFTPRAISNNPLYWSNHHRLGIAFTELDRFDEAIACYRKAIELLPNIAALHAGLGFALEKQGKSDEAIISYQKAIELDPKNAGTHNNLAWHLGTCPDLKLRDAGQAVTHAQMAVELSPSQGGYWNTLGVAHYRAGSYEEAVKALQKSLELSKELGKAENLLFLAMSQWQLEQKVEALQSYEKAVAGMEQTSSDNEELGRFRAEADELLKNAAAQ